MLNQLVNSINQGGTEVEVEFVIGTKEYIVRRGIKKNFFEIYQNGKMLNQDASIRDYQEYLEWVADGGVPDPILPRGTPDAAAELQGTDIQMIRAIDWLLEYLVGNGTVLLADIPTPLKNLYIERKAQRESVGSPQV